jgi:GTPase involved in cell partitioning and DNA repair
VDTPDIKGEYDILVNELTKYNPEMLDKERLLVISKCDMLDDELKAELKVELDVAFKDVPYMFYLFCSPTGTNRVKRQIVENAERLISCLLYFNKNSFQDFLKRFFFFVRCLSL